MALNIDASRQLRSATQLMGLAQAVLDADPSDEKNFLEWKSSLALGKNDKAGHFHVARCVLGMANRPADKAVAFFEGCGYMVIGVEPGQVTDVKVPDGADLEPWIAKYIGDDGPVWSGHLITFMGHHVYVVIVEPPRAGDRIFPLMKTYQVTDSVTGKIQTYAEGTIFVRGQARTAPATSADIRALEARLLGGRSTTPTIEGVRVVPTKTECVQVLDLSKSRIDEAVRDADARAPRPPDPEPSTSGRFGISFGNVDAISDADRSKFQTDVQLFLNDYRSSAQDAAVHQALLRLDESFDLTVVNETNEALREVRITVSLPEALRVFEDASDIADRRPTPPDPPSKFSDMALLIGNRYRPPRTVADVYLPRPVSVSKGHESVTLELQALHAGETRTTTWFCLLATTAFVTPEEIASSAWDLDVAVTAANRNGVLRDRIRVSTTKTLWRADDLLSL